MALIFTKKDETGRLVESEDYTATFEERIRTYQLKRLKNKYVIYELHRKRKPERKLTIPTSQYKNQSDLITAFKQNKIKLKVKNVDYIPTKQGRLEVVQTNYYTKFRINKRSSQYKENNKYFNPQLVCLVLVRDVKRNISGYFLGYSKKFNPDYFTKNSLISLEDQCQKMAVAKFCNVYGGVTDSSQIQTEIITRRYQFWKTIELKSKMRKRKK